MSRSSKSCTATFPRCGKCSLHYHTKRQNLPWIDGLARLLSIGDSRSIAESSECDSTCSRALLHACPLSMPPSCMPFSTGPEYLEVVHLHSSTRARDSVQRSPASQSQDPVIEFLSAKMCVTSNGIHLEEPSSLVKRCVEGESPLARSNIVLS